MSFIVSLNAEFLFAAIFSMPMNDLIPESSSFFNTSSRRSTFLFLINCSLSLVFALSGGVCGASGTSTAGQGKVLHVLFTTPESSLDPAVASDVSSLSLSENIFDPMLRYDYLARPVKLVPNTLSKMPTVSDDGLVYTFQIQPGIFFTADPAFQGKQRELTAEDYAYSLKRLYDPAVKSSWLFLFDGKLRGDDKLKQAAAANKWSADIQIEGLQVVDRYTLKLSLVAPDHNFLLQLATPATAAVAREVVEKYAGQIGAHPIGTGPYLLGQWQRNFRIQLLANPFYREVIFQTSAKSKDEDEKIVVKLRGQRLPRVSQIEVKVVEEQQARVLGLLNKEFDVLEQLPSPLSGMVMDGQSLKADLQTRGMRLALFSPLQTYYMWMNMEDPVIGGYTLEKIALRRAIALAYNNQEDIQVLEKGFAITAQSPLPPNVLGFSEKYRNPIRFDLGLANQLLDRFGYKRGADQFRRLPDGAPLELVMHSQASTTGRLRDEVWSKTMESIGIKIRFQSDKHAEILKAARLGKVQMTEANWIADFPDGENFYQLLYGPNTGRANYARFNLPAFNQRFEEAQRLGDSPARAKLFEEMAQLVHAYNPWVLRIHPLSIDITQPWLKNYKRHPVEFTNWRYLDIEGRP